MFRAGTSGRNSAYFACLPWALLKYDSDLVIEDFGAPFSSVAVPWMTARPVLGVVQWLFANEKSKQYHLPFSVVERLGVRSHRRMIAVSDDLGAELTERNPRAEVTVVANGLDEGAFDSYDRSRSGIAYLGRLEAAQKGLDLLLEAFAQVADQIEQDLILGGDGPDRDDLVAQADRLGIGDRVRFVGRIAAADRFDWLAGADLVAMPSRYETFGMVAAEALAVATPVVAFDIPCLRALVDEDVGRRVPAFEVEAFAAALLALAHDARLRRELGDAGPAGGVPQLGRSGGGAGPGLPTTARARPGSASVGGSGPDGGRSLLGAAGGHSGSGGGVGPRHRVDLRGPRAGSGGHHHGDTGVRHRAGGAGRGVPAPFEGGRCRHARGLGGTCNVRAPRPRVPLRQAALHV